MYQRRPRTLFISDLPSTTLDLGRHIVLRHCEGGFIGADVQTSTASAPLPLARVRDSRRSNVSDNDTSDKGENSPVAEASPKIVPAILPSRRHVWVFEAL